MAMSKHFQLLAVVQTALATAIAAFAAVRYTRAASEPPAASQAEVARPQRPRAEVKRPEQSDQAAIARELLRGSERFASGSGRFAEEGAERPAAQALRPLAAVLTCTEPEVNPELALDRPFGDLYVVRTPGLTLDAASLGALEHAVSALGVEVMVVLGHEKCGFLAAAATSEKPASPNLKLLFEQLMPSLKPGFGRPLEDVVHLGMARQVSVATHGIVENSGLLRARADAQHLKVLGAVFDPERGALTLAESGASWQASSGDDRSAGLPLASLAGAADAGGEESAAPAGSRASLDVGPTKAEAHRERASPGAEAESPAPQSEPARGKRAPPLVPAHAPAASPSPKPAAYEETPPIPSSEAGGAAGAPRSEARPGPAPKPPAPEAGPAAGPVAAGERAPPAGRPSSTATAGPSRRAAPPRERAHPKLAEAGGPPGVGLRAPAPPAEAKPDAETVVRNGLRAALPAVEACYESELRRHDQLRGRILVSVAVRSSGEVASARIAESTLKNPEVLDCITGRLQRLRLPPPGEDVEITLPLSLVPRE